MKVITFIGTLFVWSAIAACILIISMLVIYVLSDLVINPLIEWVFQ